MRLAGIVGQGQARNVTMGDIPGEKQTAGRRVSRESAEVK
jgi:hypothetical protein